MNYDLRLVAYTPNSDRLGLLPHPLAFQIAQPLNDVPALVLRYSRRALGADLLGQPCEVAVEWSEDGQTWTESPDARFLRIKRGTDITDETGVETFEMPGYGWQLRKIVLYAGPSPLVDGKRAFTSATPGTILQTFLAEAQVRGALPALDWTFNTTHDSAGEPWAKILTIYYQPGLDALTTLINLSEQSVVDFCVQGRTLHVYNADTELARDRTTAPRVDLLLGRDILNAPDTGTLEDAASAVLVVGDDGFRQSYVNNTAALPWGRWENFIGQGGVSDTGTAFLLAESSLARAAKERVQHTREITPHAARWLPWKDYQPGDKVIAPASGGTLAALRVRQITLTKDANGVVGGNVVLNDRFLEQSIRFARRTAGIVGGSTASGGSGAQPAPQTPRGRTAAKPVGLIVDSIAYVDASGHAQGQITATWGPVLLDVNGEAVDIDSYELFMRDNVIGAPWFLIATTEPDDTTATYSPLLVGQEYAFKVRATSQGVKGVFSDSYAVEVPDDTTAPPVPTAPTLETRLGVIHVKWDGLGVGATAMPSDFHRVRVWMQDPLDPGESEVGYLQAAGSIVVIDQPYGADREFWLTSVDHAGNESAASATATIAAAALVDTDVIGEIIDGEHIIDGTIIASDKVTASTITGALIQALQIDTGHLAANAVTANKIAAGAITAAKIDAHAVTAAKLEAILALATRIVAGDPIAARVELNSTGLAAYDAGGTQTVLISSTGSVSIVGQLSSGTTGNRLVINPVGATQPEIRFHPGTGTNYSRLYSDGSMYAGEATMVMSSGTNGAGTSRSQIVVSATDLRVHIFDPTSGLAGGGYLFAKPAELEVGYNDASANLHRFRFTSAAAQYAGKWSYSGSGAGLIMLSATINTNTGYTYPFGVTLLSTPFIVAMSDYNGDNRATVRNRTTTNFGVQVYAATTVSTTLMVWAWRA
ncbi:fibronectin type III domain-containing protein [Streptosporangium sp. NPDC049248]|uniref:fibronectin type III domain-containing protein n=1 Tax=Streptosporangium sp. NPDC049248 TaxID=3155651 RepID=UPI0034178644